MQRSIDSLEPRLPDELVMAIGRVAVMGTRLESDVTVQLWTMTGLNPRPTPSTKRVDTFTEVVKRLRQYTRKHFRGEAMTEILSWLHRAQTVQKSRHRIVHGIWGAFPDERNRHSVQTLRSEGQAEALSVQDVHDVADTIQRVRADSRFVMHCFSIQRPQAAEVLTAVTPEEMKLLLQRPDTPGIA